MPNITILPLDPTGTRESNLITDEIHAITPPVGWEEYYFIVPFRGPFFDNDKLKIVHIDSGYELKQGEDFNLGYKYLTASRSCRRPIYGAITLRRHFAGALKLQYASLGDVWSIDQVKALELMGSALRNPIVTAWDQVVQYPTVFPPLDHHQNVDSLVGMTETIASIDRITAAILDKNAGGSATGMHILDFNNPHRVNKEQVELGFVMNFPMANELEARAATRSDRYLSPQSAAWLVNELVGKSLALHIAEEGNVHKLKKEDIQLENLENYPIASFDSFVGTRVEDIDNEAYMTPMWVMYLLENLPFGKIKTFMEDKNNPTNVTKHQIDLGNVMNYGIANIPTILAGVSNEHYVTPAGVKAYINYAFEKYQHGVTKETIGLDELFNYPIITMEQINAGNFTHDTYVSGYTASEIAKRVVTNEMGDLINNSINQAIEQALAAIGNDNEVLAKLMSDLEEHINATGNVHNLRKEDINLEKVDNFATATPEETKEGLRDDLFVTPAGVNKAIEDKVDVWELRMAFMILENSFKAAVDIIDTGRSSMSIEPTIGWQLFKERARPDFFKLPELDPLDMNNSVVDPITYEDDEDLVIVDINGESFEFRDDTGPDNLDSIILVMGNKTFVGR